MPSYDFVYAPGQVVTRSGSSPVARVKVLAITRIHVETDVFRNGYAVHFPDTDKFGYVREDVLEAWEEGSGSDALYTVPSVGG